MSCGTPGPASATARSRWTSSSSTTMKRSGPCSWAPPTRSSTESYKQLDGPCCGPHTVDMNRAWRFEFGIEHADIEGQLSLFDREEPTDGPHSNRSDHPDRVVAPAPPPSPRGSRDRAPGARVRDEARRPPRLRP